MERTISFTVNGKRERVLTDEDRPLLDVLREDLGLTGTKYGCGEGECGSCAVIMDGRLVRSCTTSIGLAARRRVETIEGLAVDGNLHPVQRGFVEKEGLQCGYCVPGQIMSAVALLRDNPDPSREEIVEGMSDNICRCTNYGNILASVERAAELIREGDEK